MNVMRVVNCNRHFIIIRAYMDSACIKGDMQGIDDNIFEHKIAGGNKIIRQI